MYLHLIVDVNADTLIYFWNYNSGHNILELYNILVPIRFATSKRKLDILYSKLGIRVAERSKTYDLRKLGNIRKISNLGGYIV